MTAACSAVVFVCFATLLFLVAHPVAAAISDVVQHITVAFPAVAKRMTAALSVHTMMLKSQDRHGSGLTQLGRAIAKTTCEHLQPDVQAMTCHTSIKTRTVTIQ